MDNPPVRPDAPYETEDLDDEAWEHAFEGGPAFSPVDDDPDPAQPFDPPPVVAVVVTRNPGDWFESTLISLGSQDYPNLTVFVVDAGSDEDPTSRVAAVLPGAFVQLLEGQPGFAGAANQALASVQGAAFLMLCHDDVILAPDAIRTLVGEAVRSNAGVVGPKIVRSDKPEVLLEVGMSIDRFGVPYSGIEPGEIDQEQHDGVRDVFYVIDAAMLIRTDLFAALGGFDVDAFPGGEDLDLCWRARLVGARVMVVPDAKVGHRQASEERPALDQAGGGERARNRVRSVLKCASSLTLLWVVPVGFLLACGEALAFLLVGRRQRAKAVIGSWLGNLRRFAAIRRERRVVQKSRVVHDREISYLQTKGSARLKRFVAHYLRAEDRIRTLSDTGANLASAATDRTRLPVVAGVTAFVLVLFIGSRRLFDSVPAVGSLLQWSSVGSLWDTFTSAWRFTNAGGNDPAPAPIAWMLGASLALFGHTGMARTLLVVAILPLGAWGAVQLSRAVYGRRAIALFAGLAYVVLPVGRNAIANGRLGAMVFFAVLPFLLRRLWVAAGLADAPGADRPINRRRDLLITAAWAFVAVGVFPPALVLIPLAGAALWIVNLAVGERAEARAALLRSFAVLVLALVGLFPWVFGFWRGFDPGAVGFVFRPGTPLADAARLLTGPGGGGYSGWFLLAAVAVPLVIARGPRFVWVARGWALILAGVGFVWVPAQLFPSVPMPAPEGALAVAGVGMAIVLGTGAILVVEGLRTTGFGWQQVLSVLAVTCVIVPTTAFGVDALNGRWGLPARDWESALALGAEPGGYRVLWVGDPLVLPGDPLLRADGQGFSMTRDGFGTARDLWPAPESDAMSSVSSVLGLVEDSRTVSLGHALAPLGVRYIAVPDRAAPDAPVAGAPPTALIDGLARQRDLVRRRSEPGIVYYENAAWVPIRSGLSGAAAAAARESRGVPLVSAIPVTLEPATPIAGPLGGGTPVPEGTLLWGEAASGAWKADSRGSQPDRNTAFGAVNAYPAVENQPIALRNSWQWTRWIVVALQLGLWLAVIGGLVRAPITRFLRARREARRSSDAASSSMPVRV